jgi:tetratricopeptide (TPR) repeat protein
MMGQDGQEVPDFKYYDSLTYILYTDGKWDELIVLGNEAVSKGVDYKYLRQRIGYAYFVRGDYYGALSEFEKALSFDSFNQFTLEYLYYSLLYTGKEEYAGLIEKKLNPVLRKTLGIEQTELVRSLELEYNFKYAGTMLRSNPQYYRLGAGTKLGHRVSLMQSISKYNQVVEIQQDGLAMVLSNSQTEYYSLLNLQVKNHLVARAGYHYLHTLSGNSLTRGNLFLVSVASDLKRFSLEFNGSLFSVNKTYTIQSGIRAGYIFPGRMNFYISSGVSGLFQSQNNNIIYNQKAGLRLLKKVWLESNTSYGKMANYNDFNGLYIYNSIDPMIFKSGVTAYIPLNNKITLWLNYSWERKEFFEANSFHYNQFSYLGGIKWKL